ncbi:MAG TPA: 6-carboxytetrahydropterin synthase, partial [Dehalococcoidia bacterium]|nr:6-carboxytetrahydropterin synthase [Dehalococcoidia bacterium]
VMDFGEAKRIARAICEQLDHKFLLQTESTDLEIDKAGETYRISFGDRRYVMPASDVVSLPIENSTAELLAKWFAGEFVRGLTAKEVSNVESVTVGIEESPGAAGWYTLRLEI